MTGSRAGRLIRHFASGSWADGLSIDYVTGSWADGLIRHFASGSWADALSIDYVTGSWADGLSVDYVTGSWADGLSIDYVTGSWVFIFVRKTLRVRPRDRVGGKPPALARRGGPAFFDEDDTQLSAFGLRYSLSALPAGPEVPFSLPELMQQK